MLVWLLQPRHWTAREAAPHWAHVAGTAMLVCLGLVELIQLFAAASQAHATRVARDPVPVAPVPGTRVALLTSAPGAESLEAVRATLEGALRVRHDGPVDVWLLDEEGDPEVRRLCETLGVRHFTRKGVEHWNLPRGAFRAGARHGDHNAWLDAHGADYEFTARVATGQVPLPNYLERTLGYFRDPDIAFVVGPDVHGRHGTAVARVAESHRLLVDAPAQRAGNRYGCALFTATTNVVRVTALRQAGGLYDSPAGDLATGMAIHGHRNPATGRKWRSVHTPDVVAVGDGPSSWAGLFRLQQLRGRGAGDCLLRQFWRTFWKLRPGTLLTYTLAAARYPMTGLTWLLTASTCVLFLLLGISETPFEPLVWLVLHGTAVASRTALRLGNRGTQRQPPPAQGLLRHRRGGGVRGGRPAPRGRPRDDAVPVRGGPDRRDRGGPGPPGPDRRLPRRLMWAVLFAASLLVSVSVGRAQAPVRGWATIALLAALSPVPVWLYGALRRRVAAAAAARRTRRTTRGRHRAPKRRGSSARTARLRRAPARH